MKFFSRLAIAHLVAIVIVSAHFPPAARAQAVPTLAVLDVSFASATGGKVEVALSPFGDEATSFYVLFNSKITVLGKVGTADPSLKHFGAVRVNPDGTFDSSYGSNGISILSWSASDYPNALYMQSNNTILAAGASVVSAGNDHVPALFRITETGTADSSFGTNGRLIASFDDNSHGELTNVFPEDTTFLACGYISATNASGSNGFYAVRFRSNGTIDSSYGLNGRAFIPAGVRSVNGFLSQNATVLFTGVSDTLDKSEVVLGRLTSKGLPDPSFGTNGLKNTGIAISSKGNICSAVQQDFKCLIALPIVEADRTQPFTIARFLPDGTLDNNYAKNGYTMVPIEQIATVRGMNIANNGKTVVNGSATMSSALEACATTRISQLGTPDSSFNLIGKAAIDVDSGKYSNYIVQFSGIGFKRYIAFGGSVQDGKSKFLIARFKDDTIRSSVRMSPEANPVSLYPNPASDHVQIMSENSGLYTIHIMDAIGREVLTLPQNTYGPDPAIDVTSLPSGAYSVIVESDGSRKFETLIIDR